MRNHQPPNNQGPSRSSITHTVLYVGVRLLSFCNRIVLVNKCARPPGKADSGGGTNETDLCVCVCFSFAFVFAVVDVRFRVRFLFGLCIVRRWWCVSGVSFYFLSVPVCPGS